jgi:Icc-related predicted phosphoesterase
MRVVYAADLHGHLPLYDGLLELVRSSGAQALILGGDLCPNHADPAQGLTLQRQFVLSQLGPWLRRLRAESRVRQIYALLGNEDWASTADLFADFAGEGLYRPLHEQVHRLTRGLWIAGCSYVPVTPFHAKDWDRLEGVGPEPPFPGGGVRSAGGLLHPVTPARLEALPTIAATLDALARRSNPARTIYVCHSPPYGTALDRLRDGTPVGSRAIRAFIEQRQPPLTLHGHIHESPVVSGQYAERLGHTLAVNPGQDSALLHAAVFETAAVASTLYHSRFGLYQPDTQAATVQAEQAGR